MSLLGICIPEIRRHEKFRCPTWEKPHGQESGYGRKRFVELKTRPIVKPAAAVRVVIIVLGYRLKS